MGGSTINPSPFIKGAFLGLDLSHKKSDILRAVIEGISFDQALALEEYKKMGFSIEEIRVVGVGSTSSFWRQVMADIFNCRITYTDIGQEAAALGAAVLGAVGAGIWKDFSIVDRINKVIDIREPAPGNVEIYKKILPLYKRAIETLVDIGEIIGSI